MTMLRGNDSVRKWLNSIGVERLLIVSPHLDDAVLSVTGLLRAAAARATVLTVLTESDAQVGIEWARAAGFSDAREEHAQRRLEDLRAMQYLGCGHRHAGLRSDELNGDAVERQLQQLLETDVHHPPRHLSRLLVLLPAASGGTRPYTWFQKQWNRLLRLPFGSPAHPEHQQVRDRLWSAVSRLPVHVGFYADLPYAWRQSDAAIQAELEARFGQPLAATHLEVDLQDKLAATALYPSQMRLILGESPAYKQRVLSRPECVFLVKKPPIASQP